MYSDYKSRHKQRNKRIIFSNHYQSVNRSKVSDTINKEKQHKADRILKLREQQALNGNPGGLMLFWRPAPNGAVMSTFATDIY